MTKIGSFANSLGIISLLIISLLAAAFLSTANWASSEGTGTQVSGLISSDTMWTKANSPYIFVGPVGISSGVTLTIQPGVTVDIKEHYMQVNGTLTARGTSAEKIFFKSSYTDYHTQLDFTGLSTGVIVFTSSSQGWNEQTNIGSIIENSVLTTNQGVNLIELKSSVKIDSCAITGSRAISIIGPYSFQWQVVIPQPIISHNSISGSEVGIVCGGDLNEALISDNVIADGDLGISIYGGSPTIQRNLIMNNTGPKVNGLGGIRIDYVETTPLIKDNTIVGNTVGFNLINGPSPTIYNNNILNNIEYNVYLYPRESDASSDVNATNNWWGTTDAQAINQTIFDYKNNFNLGVVSFVPFLNAPNSQAPTASSFTISASAGAGGSISPSGSVSVSYGGSQTFTVTPNSGYRIASVLMDGAQATKPYTFYNVVSNGHTITATFELIPPPIYIIKITHVGEGTVSPSDGLHAVTSPVILQATPATNYSFMCWLENGTLLSTSNPFTYQVTNNYTITAVFYDPIAKSTPTTSTPSPTGTSPNVSPSPSSVIPELSVPFAMLSLIMACSIGSIMLKRKLSKN